MAVEYKSFSVRLEKPLREWLNRFAESIGHSPSAALRLILRNAAGDELVTAVLAEETIRIRAKTQRAVQEAQVEMWATLQAKLRELGVDALARDESYGDEELEQVEIVRGERALPARGEDIIEGEIEVEGLHGRGRRRRG